MSVDYTAELCYGYVFPSEFADYDELDERAYLVCDVIDDFDPYGMFFSINAYSSNSDVFVGFTLAAANWNDKPIDIKEIADTSKYDTILAKVVKLFNLDTSKAKDDKPQYYLLCHCH